MGCIRHENSIARSSKISHWSLGMMLAFVIALLIAAMQVVVWVKAVEARGGLEIYVRGIDFMPTIASGVAIRNGRGSELYNFDTQLEVQRQARAPYLTLRDDQLLPYIHPPFEALAIVPFLSLPYAVLYSALVLLALISVAVSCWLLNQELPFRGAAYLVLIAAVCSYQPLYQALWLGQTSSFVLLGLCGTYVALKRQREYWAAVPLLLVALKPQVFLVFGLLVLLLGHWRTLAAVIGTLAVSSIVAMPLLGMMWPFHYASFLSAIAGWDKSYAVYPASMPTIRGLLVNLLGRFPLSITVFCTFFLSLLVLILLVWCWWRVRAMVPRWSTIGNVMPRQSDWLWALTSLVAVLIPAHMGPHDHTLLLFPGWVLARYAILGDWSRVYSALWFALLWGEYAVALLTPFVTETPAMMVVPSVLLLLVMTVVLVRQIYTATSKMRSSIETVLVPWPAA